jgi:hypothetical protein
MSKRFVTIAFFQYAHEAQVFRAKLESEGIPAVIFNETISDVEPVGGYGISGVKLSVEEKDKKKALEIYNEVRRYTKDENGELLKCPNCQEEKILVSPPGKNFFFMLFPFFERKKYICNQCKTIF